MTDGNGLWPWNWRNSSYVLWYGPSSSVSPGGDKCTCFVHIDDKSKGWFGDECYTDPGKDWSEDNLEDNSHLHPNCAFGEKGSGKTCMDYCRRKAKDVWDTGSLSGWTRTNCLFGAREWLYDVR